MATRTAEMLLAALILTAIFSRMDVAVESAAADCYDACSTACVQPDARLMARCDRKCQIKCEPGLSKVGEMSAEIVPFNQR
ncbi:hypothetical protein NL676_039443 [Syzygium grande]|nr:hypothetical protein NL676_039443 [Syzygium grande]